MSSVSGAIGAYYAVKNMNASIAAHASLQKLSQDAMTQQMKDLLKAMPSVDPNLGRTIDMRV
ncbi:MAG: putative motility protein [Thermoclostridium sp.]|nr:putative motility protein [Thermoclostridium sp.]